MLLKRVIIGSNDVDFMRLLSMCEMIDLVQFVNKSARGGLKHGDQIQSISRHFSDFDDVLSPDLTY